MAICQDNRLAPASKAEDAQRLISQSIIAANIIAAGLRRIQQLPNAALANDLGIIRGIADEMADVASGVRTVLEGELTTQ